jgi:HTH-type transcriptional regulator/antitoxin HigA
MARRSEAPALMAIHPGSILKEELIERGISQKDFAKMISMQPSHLSEIIKGKRSVTKPVADKLEEVLGIPSIDWVNLQIGFEYDTQQKAERQVAEMAAYNTLQEYSRYFDARTLEERLGKVHAFCSETVEFLKNVFKLPEPERLQLQTQGLFKKSAKVGKDPVKIMTWLLLAKQYAYSNVLETSYDEDRLDELIPKISAILHENENTIQRLEETFAEYGILFGVVSRVQGASIDGYSFEYDGHPCIIVTKRYDRIDNLAFSIMHELGHVKNHDYDDFNVDIGDYDHESPREKAANQFAANALISDADWKTVPEVRLSALVIQRTCSLWAESRGYNKWIALGRLSYQTGMYKFKTDATRFIS